MKLLLLAVSLLASTERVDAACRQALMLGLDVSGSVDQHEYRLQMDGLVIGPKARANTTKNLANVKTPEEYYRSFVLRGPGAFVQTADGFEDFARAIRRKLLREVSGFQLSGWSARQ